MAWIGTDGKTYRNQQEQVYKNMIDINDIQELGILLNTLGLKVIAEVADTNELNNLDTATYEYGDAVLVGTQPPKTVYVWTRATNGTQGTNKPHWAVLSNFTGQTGEQGLIGETGKTGVRGSTWTTGNGSPIGSANELDLYLDKNSCYVYQYINGTWGIVSNIKGNQGSIGLTGNGIQNIILESSSDNVDTYKIIYTDGAYTTFKIINGINGKDGLNGGDISFYGPLATISQLPAASAEYKTRAYFIGASSPYEVYYCINDGNDNYSWIKNSFYTNLEQKYLHNIRLTGSNIGQGNEIVSVSFQVINNDGLPFDDNDYMCDSLDGGSFAASGVMGSYTVHLNIDYITFNYTSYNINVAGTYFNTSTSAQQMKNTIVWELSMSDITIDDNVIQL